MSELEVEFIFNPVGGSFSVGHVDSDSFVRQGALYEADALKDIVARYVRPRDHLELPPG